MEDLAGIGRILDSKVAQRAYEDVASEPARQVGHLSTDIVKTFRLFTAPIQLLATAQDRFERWLGKLRDSVPEDRQVEAAPEIAGPALMNLRFLSEENQLRYLYLNLLRLAIDRDHRAEAHPGFIKVIEQMSPYDAQFLQQLAKVAPIDDKVSKDTELPAAFVVQRVMGDFNVRTLPEIQASLDLLRGLSVLDFDCGNVADFDGPGYKFVDVYLTQFGINFVRSCIPDDWCEGSLQKS